MIRFSSSIGSRSAGRTAIAVGGAGAGGAGLPVLPMILRSHAHIQDSRVVSSSTR